MRSVNLQSNQPVSSKSPLTSSSISPTCEPLPMESGVFAVHKRSSYGILDSQAESNLPTPYVTAPSSPVRSSTPFNATPCFYSYPTSPVVAGGFSTPFSGKSAHDDFEFGSSSRWFESPSCNKEEQQKIRHAQGMPSADELFSNGQLRPLKLPPRLQVHHVGSKPSSRVSSPTRSTSCYTFYSHRLKKKEDFDPFAAALEEVRKEDVRFEKVPPRQLHRHRRTQSGGHEHHKKPSWQVAWAPKEAEDDIVGATKARWRLVPPIGHSVTNNMRASAFSGPATAGGGRGHGQRSKAERRWMYLVHWSNCRKMSQNRQLHSSSFDSDTWAYAWHKATDEVAMAMAMAKAELRCLTFRGLVGAQYGEGEGVGAQQRCAEKKALTKYKPNKLLLCFGLNCRG